MLAGQCCSVSSLAPISSFSLCFHHKHWRLFLPFSFCRLLLLSFLSPQPPSLSSCFWAVLSFLPKPSCSAHPPSPRFTLLCCFLCSFPTHYFLCCPFLSYPFPAGNSSIQVYSFDCAVGAGSAGLWLILALTLLLISLAAQCTHVSNIHKSKHIFCHVRINTFFMFFNLWGYEACIHFFIFILYTQFVSPLLTHSHSYTHIWPLGGRFDRLENDYKMQAKWLAGFTLDLSSLCLLYAGMNLEHLSFPPFR